MFRLAKDINHIDNECRKHTQSETMEDMTIRQELFAGCCVVKQTSREPNNGMNTRRREGLVKETLQNTLRL